MNIKDNKAELEKILNLTNTDIPLPGTGGSGMDDDLPEPEPLFDIDYNKEDRKYRRKARRTVTRLIQHMIPTEYFEEDYIKDKMEQDIDTLANLYWQYEMNKVMIKANMEGTRIGGGSPRMYETFVQLSKNMNEINKQILQTETVIRQTYVMIKGEVQQMKQQNANIKQLENQKENVLELPTDADNSVTIRNNKDVINALVNKRKQRDLQQLEEVEDVEELEENIEEEE